MCRRICYLLFLLCFFSGLKAQNRNKNEALESVQDWFENLAIDAMEQANEEDISNALEYFEQLLSKPLNINKAKKGDLEKLFILNDFQIASLLEYRDKSGYILSGAELSLINGFNEQLVDLLRAFIVFDEVYEGSKSYFGGDRGGNNNFFSNCNSTFLLKVNRILKREEWYSPISKEEYENNPDSRYIGTPYYTQLKYKCEYNNRVQVGFTLENDAGETFLSKEKIPIGDFFSFHTMFKELKMSNKKEAFRVKSIIIGDYCARFGQGLTVWNGFSLSGSYTPNGFFKRGEVVSPYTSSDENKFFRGVGVNFEKELKGGNVINFTSFFSKKKIDAKVADGVYSSLVTDGKHNTISALNNRKVLGETVYGADANVVFRNYKVGVSWVNYFYDAKNGRRVREYNKYQMYDGVYGNFGLDFYAVFGKCRLFGEMGVDYGGNMAMLLSGIEKIGNWDLGCLVREYSKKYIAPYANGYSTISQCANQRGTAISAGRIFGKGYKISFGADLVYYPWVRFNINEPSTVVKGWGRIDYSANKVTYYLKLYDNYTTYKNVNKIGLRGVYGYKFYNWLGVKCRGEVVVSPLADKTDYGYAFATDLDLRMFNNILRVQLRCAYYKCEEWNCRLYMYEADLPSSYTSQMLYKEGVRWYAIAQLKIGRWGNLYIKGDDNSKLKVGLKARF